MVKLTPGELSKFCVNTRDMWDVVVRCGYYLPKFKSKMISEDFMHHVMLKKSWCPLFKEIRLIPCPTPPNKSELLAKFWDFIDSNKLQIVGVDREKHIPDKRWLLDVLSSYTPDDEIFAKKYKPPPRKGRLADYATMEIPEEVLNN